MKLNGWQRIGIVASIAWAVATYFYQMDQSVKFASHLAGSEWADCLTDATRKHQPETSTCSKLLSDRMELYTRGSAANAAIAALVPIPLGWLLVYVVIWVVRWIQAGFRKV